ncbi:protein phosphatase 1 regulatory subunit 3A isoform X2 [Ictalurus furcatus]|uniref:protein phosphatase 1 regulatory subunit 3A isoform X2 n=1 Tax=Ictalurus furcatus TaxID=66913 RepID=UPI002350BD46|nr:protein phosphatase 1 regulatory subunit 3A isoform X2 [Ictalurus furcatus]
MAQGNHLLTIPKQEGLFTTIKNDDSPVEDDDEEETEEDVCFIPRCSPVPRKRGPSIIDETAEYMRIRLALPQRRVSFADAAGGDLVDVREIAVFDTADEEDNADWEEEEAKYRRAYLQPVYRVWPEFQARAESDLTLAVRANKVEVEKVTAVQDEPLAFDALICVLNVSYHKCVYVRSTMDGWITHTDSAAEYVQGSHDGDTDKFSARLSFVEPYLFNGARIDFGVRYETSDGEFWANNSGRNYSVTLVVSYEEDTVPVNKVDDREIKGILKPPRYRAEDDFYPDTDDGNGDTAIFSPVCPLVIEPEIDIEIPEASISSSKTKDDPTIAECPLLSADRQDEYPLQDLPTSPSQTGHLEKGQGREILIPTENITFSIQNEAPDNDRAPNSDRHFVHSAESNQPFCPNQDNPESDTAVQEPFDLDITLPAMFPSIQDMGEDHRENDEIQPGERRMTQLQGQTSDMEMEIDNTDSSLQELLESTQQCSLMELITANASKGDGDFGHSTGDDILFEESHEPLLENPEKQMIRRETREKEQAGLMVGEEPDMIASSMRKPFEPTDLGQTREDIVTQNVPSPPRSPDPELAKYQQPGQGPVPEVKEVPEVLSVNVDIPSGSECASPKEESPMLTSISSATVTSQSLSTIVQAVAPEAGKPSMTQEDPLFNEEFELHYNDPASIKKQEVTISSSRCFLSSA